MNFEMERLKDLKGENNFYREIINVLTKEVKFDYILKDYLIYYYFIII